MEMMETRRELVQVLGTAIEAVAQKADKQQSVTEPSTGTMVRSGTVMKTSQLAIRYLLGNMLSLNPKINILDSVCGPA